MDKQTITRLRFGRDPITGRRVAEFCAAGVPVVIVGSDATCAVRIYGKAGKIETMEPIGFDAMCERFGVTE